MFDIRYNTILTRLYALHSGGIQNLPHAYLFIMSKNERRFGNEDDSKNEGACSNKSEDAAALVEQEDGEGDDQDGGGEQDGRGVTKGKPGQGCRQEKFDI